MSLDAARLRKIAALLDSPVDGEALSALRRASHVLSRAGLSIADVLVAGATGAAGPTAAASTADEDLPMPEKAMVCRFAVLSADDLAGGLRVLRVRPSTREGGATVEYRACVATGRTAAVIEARLFQDPTAEFLAKFSVPFRTHREEPKVASVQPIA